MGKPIIKWVGGKRSILNYIRPRCPHNYDNYHEPFMGGGAVFFDLEPATGTLNDLNSSLVNLYEVVIDHPEKLIEENRTHTYERDYYNQARDEFNDLRKVNSSSKEDKIREASLMIYLIQTGFNGLYRENNDGEYNVPFGTHSDPNFVLADRIRSAKSILDNFELYNEDFEYIRDVASKRDFVYFDPPYQPVSRTADFTQYQADDFEKKDQRRLRNLVLDLDSEDVSILMSNSPPVRELYEDYPQFEIEVVQAPRHINSDAENRGDVAEVLIHNMSDQNLSTLASFEDG